MIDKCKQELADTLAGRKPAVDNSAGNHDDNCPRRMLDEEGETRGSEQEAPVLEIKEENHEGIVETVVMA